MTTVKQLLDTKRGDVWAIGADASVYDALEMMARGGVGALLVMDGGKLRGIISERDYTRKVILEGRSSRDTPVRDIMTSRVVYVRPEQTVEECMALMTDEHIRHLPVLVDGNPIGVVSIRDLVKSLISDKDRLIENLENYITGR
jgi:CBS domain-containing protein